MALKKNFFKIYVALPLVKVFKDVTLEKNVDE
jgi:hypothetical protein